MSPLKFSKGRSRTTANPIGNPSFDGDILRGKPYLFEA